MSEINALEKLRGLCDEAASKMVDNPKWVCKRAEEIAGEIETEIEREWMRLPVDADGEPVRVGDKLVRQCDPNIYKVEELKFDGKSWWYGSDGDFYACKGARHKPRTLEDVLHDFAFKAVRIGMEGGVQSNIELYSNEDAVAEYADEIRAMFGEAD